MSSDGAADGRFVSGTVTFLFTDIERSTELLKTLGRARYVDTGPRARDSRAEGLVRPYG